ncbi:FmdB family zinc ribbon protein [Thermanaeromonas sp. C210]|uniref:FmdB family zinc ribbon protein n=1 Tax=Thermanaeromonas sp. C210 TaxID=2731925 RepID=UPI001563560A|nr:zinc ribbon domain-containing protein [Thermanaeromonas sp. C210]
MPTYEFRCQDCGNRFTVRLSWQEKDKATCPSCGGRRLQQLFTGITILAGGSSGGGCASPAGSRFS